MRDIHLGDGEGECGWMVNVHRTRNHRGSKGVVLKGRSEEEVLIMPRERDGLDIGAN